MILEPFFLKKKLELYNSPFTNTPKKIVLDQFK